MSKMGCFPIGLLQSTSGPMQILFGLGSCITVSSVGVSAVNTFGRALPTIHSKVKNIALVCNGRKFHQGHTKFYRQKKITRALSWNPQEVTTMCTGLGSFVFDKQITQRGYGVHVQLEPHDETRREIPPLPNQTPTQCVILDTFSPSMGAPYWSRREK